jgi:hypothetical protein
MSDKYRAIVEAGFILQIDDPGIATSWDMIKPEPSLADLPEIRDAAEAAGTARMSTTSLSNTSSTSRSR